MRGHPGDGGDGHLPSILRVDTPVILQSQGLAGGPTQEGRDEMTAWLNGLTPWMVAATLVLTAWMCRNELMKRPHGMPGEYVKWYRFKRIYTRHYYNEHPDSTGTDPTGNDEFYVEHGSRSYPTLEAALEAIRDGSWSKTKR